MELDEKRFLPILTGYIESGPASLRRSALRVLLYKSGDTWEGLAVIEELTKHLGEGAEDVGVRKAIRDAIRHRKGYLRAQEPMAVPLNKEANQQRGNDR